MNFQSFIDSDQNSELKHNSILNINLSFNKIFKVSFFFSIQVIVLLIQFFMTINRGNDILINSTNSPEFISRILLNLIINYLITGFILLYLFILYTSNGQKLPAKEKRSILKFYIVLYFIFFLIFNAITLFNFYYTFNLPSGTDYSLFQDFINLNLFYLIFLWLIIVIVFLFNQTISFIVNVIIPKDQSDISRELFDDLPPKYKIETEFTKEQILKLQEIHPMNSNVEEYDTPSLITEQSFFSKINPKFIYSYKKTMKKLHENEKSTDLTNKFLLIHKNDFKIKLRNSTPINFKEKIKNVIINDYSRLFTLFSYNKITIRNNNAALDFTLEIFSPFITVFEDNLQEVYSKQLLNLSIENSEKLKIVELIESKFEQTFSQWKANFKLN